MPPSAFRVSEILTVMRDRLLNGTYPRKSRLPVRSMLQSEFRTSPAAMQEVINSLRMDGQIVSRGKLGTYVADHPPCLDRFAWIYPEDHFPYRRRTLHAQLRSLCLQNNQATQDQSHTWHYALARDASAEAEQRIRVLCEDIARRRVAALVVPVGSFNAWVNEFLRPWPAIPTVRFAYSPTLQAPSQFQKPTLYFPVGRFISEALDHLSDRGLRKIGLWTCGALGKAFQNAWEAQIAGKGMQSDPLWMASMGEDSRAAQAECILRLMQASPRGLPEAFVILDDILAGAVTTAIYNLKIKVPAELQVVIYAHFPGTSVNPFIPTTQFGHSIPEVLDACMELIRRQQAAPGSTPLIELTPRKETPAQ